MIDQLKNDFDAPVFRGGGGGGGNKHLKTQGTGSKKNRRIGLVTLVSSSSETAGCF